MLAQAPAQLVIGTAGHVDHGKSTLVRALTGSDPDRLPQEKQRGLSIELGFAFMLGAEHGYDCDIGFIDCPGHSKFLHHAISGMGAMNACLLIIAADEGISAQTREHLEILRLLNLEWGRVVISKSALASAEQHAQLIEDVQLLCSGTVFNQQPPLLCDAIDGSGIDALRRYVFEEAAQRIKKMHDERLTLAPRLGIDRVFHVKGHGTVVTGTLLNGQLQVDEQIACYPGPQARIRGLQVHGTQVATAIAGQRCAINLAGVDKDAIERGSILSLPQHLRPSVCVDALATIIEPGVKHGAAVKIFYGAGQYSARIILLEAQSVSSGQARIQIRFDQPIYAQRGETLIIRRPSPAQTIGAATVLALDAPRHKRFHARTRQWFDDLQSDALTRFISWLEQRDSSPATLADAIAFCGTAEAVDELCQEAGQSIQRRPLKHETYFWGTQAWQRMQERATDVLREHVAKHMEQPWLSLDRVRDLAAPDCPSAAWEDRLAAWQLHGALQRQQRLLCLPTTLPKMEGALATELQALELHYREAAFMAAYNNPICDERADPSLARRALQIAAAYGWLIRLSDRQHMHRATVVDALEKIRTALAASGNIDFQWAKQTFNASRRYLLPLLEWFDLVHITQRQDKLRVAGSALAQQIPVPLLKDLPE